MISFYFNQFLYDKYTKCIYNENNIQIAIKIAEF